MQTQEFRGLMEVARATGIPYYRIIYAENAGRLPAPMRVANKRVYSAADIDRIRAYFDEKGIDEEGQNGIRKTQRKM